MDTYPKVKAVKPLQDKKLLITFQNQVQKIYDCTILLKDRFFVPLTDEFLFSSVKADKGGYGISWNEEIDLSESELWIHGVAPDQGFRADGNSAR